MTTFITTPPKGGGTITVDKPTKESDTTRPLWYAGWLLAIRLLALLLLILEIVLVGEWAGPLLVIGSLWYAADGAGFWIQRGGIPKFEYRMKKGILRDLTWLLGSGLGYVLTLAAATGYWLPVEWQVSDKLLWLVTPWGTEAVLPQWYTIPIWLRWVLIVGMPWITWRPFSLLHWVFEAESTFKNLREVSFSPADPGALDTPLGRVRSRPEERAAESKRAPETSAPLRGRPTGRVKLVTPPASENAPPVDLI